MHFFTRLLAIAPLLIATGAVGAQTPLPQSGVQPLYTITINVVERTTQAINYQHRNGSTTIDFQGTVLMPEARGEAKVESKQGYMEVEVEFDDLQSATRFGPAYLTYVLWAITPEGRATNMGEIILNGTKSKLDVTTELQAFGMIVTAEPYFAVSQPGDVVVMDNVFRRDTEGTVEDIEAKYQLLARDHYTANALPSDLTPMRLDRNTSLDIYQARNAVRIAQWAGADVSAADSFDRAKQLLAGAEASSTRNLTVSAMTARQAVQTAEDARLIALKNQADAQLAEDRAASARGALAATTAVANARANVEDARTNANDANRAREVAEAEVERSRLAAELSAERAASARAAVETANQQARQAADQSKRDQQDLRDQLAGQLNRVLQTQDSARGLIVEMSDVLFGTGQYALRPGSREMLAKISGIILAYPMLRLRIEGHTDNVGSDELNLRLSENRANAVREFLITQGIDGSSIEIRGYGEGQPVATNDTAAGRQENRRVELVVSGEAIGNSGPSPDDTRPQQ